MMMFFDWHGQDTRASGPLEVAHTITATYGMGGGNTPMVVHNLTPGETQAQKVIDEKGVCSCLDANERSGAHSPYTLTRATGINGDVAGTLDANYYRGTGERGYTEREVVFQAATCADLENLPDQIVRRLIPLECGRLQGFPDGWGEIAPFGTRPDDAEFWKQAYTTVQQIAGKKTDAKTVGSTAKLAAWYRKLHSRQAEYKMWGNGMALPNALFFVQRAVEIAVKERHTAKENIKLGSLFDGSGTMPLAAELCGARAVWASEIEPYPIAVTRTHLPDLVHLGSVTEIDGGKIPPVDIITFGSPCQDLSTAGKRAGMKNTSRGDDETTRSGLFFEAIRIAREMLAATSGKYPRFMIWENVPGALSSNNGADFEVVLNELLQLSGTNDAIRQHDRWGGYADYGAVAYRVVNAQYWGIPQRRRRIYAVADTGGESAGLVAFERKGAAWNFEPGGETQRAIEQGRVAGLPYNCYQWHDRMVAKSGTEGFCKTLKERAGKPGGGKGPLVTDNLSATLATHQDQAVITNAFCDDGRDHSRALIARMDGSPMIDKGPSIAVQETLANENGYQNGSGIKDDGTMFTLTARDRHMVLTGAFTAGQGAKAGTCGFSDATAPTLKADGGLSMMPSVVMERTK